MAGGETFVVMVTSSGRVYYSGKGKALAEGNYPVCIFKKIYFFLLSIKETDTFIFIGHCRAYSFDSIWSREDCRLCNFGKAHYFLG